MLPLSVSVSADPVLPMRMQSSSIAELVGPLGPVGTLLPGEDGPGLCQIGLTVGRLPVAAVSASGPCGIQRLPCHMWRGWIGIV